MGKHKPIYDPSGTFYTPSGAETIPEPFFSGLRRLRDRYTLAKSQGHRAQGGAAAVPETLDVPRRPEGDAVQGDENQKPGRGACAPTSLALATSYTVHLRDFARSFGTRSRECCPRTSYVSAAWSASRYSPRTAWAYWARMSCEAGKTAPFRLTTTCRSPLRRKPLEN